jgi:UDP-N-acetylmuramate: L-alanyl-gamma-D-glutamyl-meso-diaminopimelate ligase
MMGQMNIRNALGVTALCCSLGIPATDLTPGFATFLGVERRQELIGETRGITIIDDFAHHPTAVTVTIEAVKMRYPQRRLWAVFEPRSNTCRRRIFQQPLAKALARADGVIIGPVFTKPQDPIATEELFSPAELTADLQQLGKKVHAGQGTEEMVAFLTEQCRAGDVVLIMSNGAFGGLPRKLLTALQAR